MKGQRKMKKSFVIGLALSLIIAFSFTGEQKAAPNQVYIPVIVKIIRYPFWDLVKSGAERAAADYGIEITFEGIGPELQVEEQVNLLRTALARNPQAIVLSAVDSRALTPYLEEAQGANIPVVGIDSGVDSPIVQTTVGIDNYGAGVLAADKMAELLNKKGEVGLITIDPISKISIDRRDGFVDTINQQYPDMTVVDIKYGIGDATLSAEAAKEMIEAHPNIKGIFGANQGSVEGIIRAVKELNKIGDFSIIGFDSGKELLDAIREGIVAGAITQNPVGMGYQSVQAAYRAYLGERIPEFIDTGIQWYDKSNIDSPELQGFFYK
jgi:ribose transport system substrate-binding protein